MGPDGAGEEALVLLVGDCKTSALQSLSVSHSPSFPVLLLLPPSRHLWRSADLWCVALLHQPFLIVRLTQDHVVLQEELVSHTKPVEKKNDRKKERER